MEYKWLFRQFLRFRVNVRVITNNTIRKLLTFSIVVPAIIYIAFYKGQPTGLNTGYSSKIPLILFYTRLFLLNDERRLPDDFSSDYINCTYQCYFTLDQRNASNADAVVFNINKYSSSEVLPAVEENFRSPEQIWVMLSWETPMNKGGLYNIKYLKRFANIFNWTWTFYRDSDVVFTYGKITKRQEPDWSKKFERFQRKNRTAVILMSHCSVSSQRIHYITQLIEAGLDVDVIGKCRDRFTYRTNISEDSLKLCEKDQLKTSNSECDEFIKSNFMFYLAFENSLCPDYITEKFYKAASLNLIPVVRNGASMSQFAPERSYIDYRDFKSPKQLADYLNKVALDSKLYNSYFQWKPFYNVEHTFDKLSYLKNLCELCEKVHEHRKQPKTKVYENMYEWFVVQRRCHLPFP